MDPLSDVLALLRPRNTMCGGFDAGGDWSLLYPAHEGIKCYAVVSGGCWLAVDGVPEPTRLEAGDGFLLPRGRSFRLASDLALPSVDFKSVVQAPLMGRVTRWGGGGGCFGVGGFFALDGEHVDILLEMLPPIVHLRRESERQALRWSIERMMEELRDPQPGGLLVLQQLAQMLLVQALRAHLADATSGGVGWLAALADREIGPTLQAIHADPARRWTLEGLAERVGMSRSGFAQRFKATVGESPIGYLTRWRMLLAADRLARSGDSVAAVALALGYESESAFSTAFKRVMGCSPRRYGRDRGRPPVEASATATAGAG